MCLHVFWHSTTCGSVRLIATQRVSGKTAGNLKTAIIADRMMALKTGLIWQNDVLCLHVWT